MIRFKSGVNPSEYFALDWRLKLLLAWLEYEFEMLKKPMVITELSRVARHENDLHAQNRAADVRTSYLDETQIKRILTRADLHSQYDFERHLMSNIVYHEASPGSGFHFHCQVHPNTQFYFY